MKEKKTLGRFHDLCHNKGRTDWRKGQASGSFSGAVPHPPKEGGDRKCLVPTGGAGLSGEGWLLRKENYGETKER